MYMYIYVHIYAPRAPHLGRARVRGRRGASAAQSVKVQTLTQSVYKVVLRKSNPPQIRQLILYYY